MEYLPSDISYAEFIAQLRLSRVPFNKWREPKTPRTLYDELRSGKSRIGVMHLPSGEQVMERYVDNILIALCRLSLTGRLELLRESQRITDEVRKSLRPFTICGKVLSGRTSSYGFFDEAANALRTKIGLICGYLYLDHDLVDKIVETASEHLTNDQADADRCVLVNAPLFELPASNGDEYLGILTHREMNPFLCLARRSSCPGKLVTRQFGNNTVVLKWTEVTVGEIEDLLAGKMHNL